MSEQIIKTAKALREKFIKKVETGRARSRETYAECLALLEMINTCEEPTVGTLCGTTTIARDQAIKWIKDIQNGDYDRNAILDQIPRGKLAINDWNEGLFSLGMEYGAISTIMIMFNIKKDELHLE